MSTARPPALAGAAALLLGLAATWSACHDAAGGSREPADLLLLYASNVHGYIEPCGCVAGQIGGIDRIAGYVERELAARPDDALFVDAGDLLAETRIEDLPERLQMPIKARTLFEVWGRLGCEAMALGENDLAALGHEELKALSEEFDVPILCGNLVEARTGEPVFPSHRIVERAGLKIGFFSLIAPDLVEPKAKDAKPVDVQQIAHEQGLRILPWRPELERLAAQLANECDLVVFLSHLGFDLNVKIARQVPGLDLVFGGHFGNSKRETNFVEGTPVLVPFVRGSRVGRVEWWWREPEQYFTSEVHGPLVDVSEWHATDVALEVERAHVEDLATRELALGTEEWKKKVEHHERELARFENARARLGPFPESGNVFSHVLVPMHFALTRSEWTLALIDRYHHGVNDYWMSKSSNFERSGHYVGAQVCQECHPRQYEFWLATRHSHAFSTLQATHQEVDAECIGCHTVGYQEPGGFPRPHLYAGFENVQCAACHGAGGRHVRGGTSYFDPDALRHGALACARCHDEEHDPPFAEEALERLPLVACPPLEPHGAGAPALLETFRSGADLLARAQNPQWGAISLLRSRAGDVIGALDAALSWYAQQPRNLRARANLGQRYLEAGRPAEAVPHFEAVVAEQPNDADSWRGLSAAIRATDAQRAERAALEAFSLEPSALGVRLLALALLEQNRRASASEQIRAWIERVPADEALFADLAPLLE